MSAASGLEARLVIRRASDFSVDVGLRAEAGQTVALVGPNGSGKTTVVEAVAGLLELDDGFVHLDGRPLEDVQRSLRREPAERQIGVVFQDYLLFPHLSALDNVAFGLVSRGVPRSEARRRASAWLERLGVGEVEGHSPRELSGGQAQRVSLARALAFEPRALLLDEPLAAVDAAGRGHLRQLLSGHLESFEGPRLLVTHDPKEAFLLADRVVVLEGGRVTQEGRPEEIRARPRSAYAADFAGPNLVAGEAADGWVEASGRKLRIASTRVRGPVLVTVHPRAISLHHERPEGSPRNIWECEVTAIERLGERVRVLLGGPLPMTAEVTPEACSVLELVPGVRVWLSIKATEMRVEPL